MARLVDWLSGSLSHAHMMSFSQLVTSSVSSPSPLLLPVPCRKQLQDLSGQHQQELASQLAQFKVEMAEREERQQQVAEDYELRSWSPECPFQAPAPFSWVESKLKMLKSCSLD